MFGFEPGQEVFDRPAFLFSESNNPYRCLYRFGIGVQHIRPRWKPIF